MDMTDEPDEVITVVQCVGCEGLSFPADLEGGDVDKSLSQLYCPRCGTQIKEECFSAYVDLRVVDYE